MAEQKMTHWKQLQDSPYLGAYSLQPGQELILTIASVGKEKVIGTDGKKEDCTVIHFAERGVKPMVVNATNAKSISKVAGSPYIERWVGVKIQIYADNVKAFGDIVEALRVREFKPATAPKVPKCSACKTDLQAAYGKSPAALAQYTKEKYGEILCAACAEKRASEPTGEVSAE